MQSACVLLQYPDIFYEVFEKYKLTNSDFNPSVTSFVAGGDIFRVLPLCSTQPRTCVRNGHYAMNLINIIQLANHKSISYRNHTKCYFLQSPIPYFFFFTKPKTSLCILSPGYIVSLLLGSVSKINHCQGESPPSYLLASLNLTKLVLKYKPR